MRYWTYFAAKLVAAVALSYGLLVLMNGLLPNNRPRQAHPQFKNAVILISPSAANQAGQAPADSDGDAEPGAQPIRAAKATALLGVWFLVSVGLLYLVYRDQRNRCRVCLRRLRMPVESGSWGFMLQLGRPRVEYICPYGHGSLKEEELQIYGLETPEWTRHSDDIWEELYAASKDAGEQK